MKQNIRTTRYADWSAISTENYHLPDIMDTIESFGIYYDHNVLLKSRIKTNQTVCPAGWRLPDGFDWNSLILAAGGDENTAGYALKEVESWPINGDNTTGFSANPAGYFAEAYGEGSWYPTYAYKNNKALFWFAPQGSKPNLTFQTFQIEGDDHSVYNQVFDTTELYDERYVSHSVRCIRSVYEAPVIGSAAVKRKEHQSISIEYEVLKSGFRPTGTRGIVWSTETNPTLENHLGKATEYLERGEFEQTISGLNDNTTYYIRVFATNDLGTDYSSEIVATTEEYTSVFDYDANEYQTRVIGGREWMLRNLETTRYNNGEEIHQSDNSGFPQDPYITWYPTPGSKAIDFGALYAFNIANDPRGICPAGFKLPHRDEWLALFDAIGGKGIAGGKLKSTDTGPEGEPYGDGFWLYPNSGATDHYGFNAKPSGYQSNSGYYPGLNSGDPDMEARFWSSTLAGPTDATVFHFNYDSPETFETTEDIQGSTYWACHSVRCIREIPGMTYKATVFTNPIITRTSNSLTLSGQVFDDGGGTIAELGFCYGLNWYPTIEDTKINLGTNPEDLHTVIGGLEGLTYYHVRAYVVNENGISYGNNQFRQTLSPYSPPKIKTGTVAGIMAGSAEGYMEIMDDGLRQITEAGLVWNSSRMPTKETNEGIAYTNTDIGVHVATLTSLSPGGHYVVRAFATNSEGTSYGREVIFTTNPEYTLPAMMSTTFDSISVLPLYISQNAPWGDTLHTGASDFDNGQTNTDSILFHNDVFNNEYYAAKICSELDAYGFNDYYLPSITELDSIYNRRAEFGITTTNSIWSSTENNDLTYAKSFSSGLHLSYGKNNTGNETFCVRKNIPVFEIQSNADYGGTISPKGIVRFLAGENAQFTFSVEPWAISHQLWIDGMEEFDSLSSYRFNGISENHTIYLEVTVPEYELTYNAETGGTLSGDTPQYVYHNQDGTAVEAIADENFVFLKWSDDRTDNPRIDKNVTENISVSAIFIEGVKDYDGNIYQIVNLSGYIWMTSNLKAVHDQNGDTITGWAYCNNLPENNDTYGLLYEWINNGNPCPQGFEFPTDSDWQGFEENFLGMSTLEVEATGARGTSGGELKEPTLDYWQSPNSGATNSSGFTALPGGEYIEGTGFVQLGNEAHFWTSNEFNATSGWYRKLIYDSNAIFRDPAPKTSKKSIRCFKPWS